MYLRLMEDSRCQHTALRAVFKVCAQDCGKAGTVLEITNALLTRFTLIAREAQDRIALLRGQNTSYQEHVTEVEN